MAKLKKMLTHRRNNESGQGPLAMVLILLMLGAIILTPLLVFMQTGLGAGRVYESKMQEFYAADAGIEDAIWNITYANLPTPANYTLAEEVNNRITNVNVTDVSGGGYSGYKIISTATSNSGGNTTIECYYGTLDYSSLLDNAISSNDTVKLQPNLNVTGNVRTTDCIDAGYPSCGCPNCTYSLDCLNCTRCCSEEPLSWPTAETLSAWYLDNVNVSDPFLDPEIDIEGSDTLIGPLYRDGTLDIYNSKNKPATATLNGTVYVTDDLNIATTNKDFTLNLSGYTIYCEGNITVGPHKPNIVGSGCIIAVGDNKFQPGGDVGSNTTFVLVMSIEETVTLQPDGDFYGTVAGNAEVNLQPGNTLCWTGCSEGIDFPMGQSMMKVLSYTIK